MQFRICFAFMKIFVNFEPDGSITGPGSYMVKTILDEFKRLGNLSIVMDEKIGDMIDRENLLYDGCIGKLQNNQSDTFLPSIEYPVVGPNLATSAVTSSTTIVIGSVYNNSIPTTAVQVMEAFKSFSTEVWMSIANVLLILNLLIILSLCCLKRGDLKISTCLKAVSLSFQSILAAVLKQHSPVQSFIVKFSGRLILFLLSYFTFLMAFYFASLIKTDAVVFKTPDTISTYDDLLRRPNMRPMWMRGLNDHSSFESADKTSQMGRIWQRAVSMGVNQSRFGYESEELGRAAKLTATKQAVVLVSDLVMRTIVTNICSYSRITNSFTDVNLWYKSGPGAKEKLDVHVVSSYTNKHQRRTYEQITRRSFEFGIISKNMEGATFIPCEGKCNEVRDCASNQIIIPKHTIDAPGFRYFKELLVGIVFAFQLGCIFLIMEQVSRIKRF